MKEQLNQMIKKWSKTSHPSTIRLFAVIINLWMICNFLILSQAHSHFWSSKAYIATKTFEQLSFFEKIFGLLHLTSFEGWYPFLIIAQVLSSLLVILNFKPFLFQLIASWCMLSLDSKTPVILDGGNNLMHLLAIYLPLLLLAPEFMKFRWLQKERAFLANGVFLIARLQVVLVYACAGFSKVQGELWPKGVALYYTMGVQEYGHPLIAQLMSYSLPLVLASYATVFFQVSFPFLVWNRFLRPFYLAMGTLFHLGIAFGMGLMSFGFAMCSSYFIFYTNQKAQSVLQKLKTFFSPSKITIGFDENCLACQRFARCIRFFDWQKKVVFDKAHNPLSKKLQSIPYKERTTKIYAHTKEKNYSGFSVLFQIILRLPLLKLVAPIFFIFDLSGLGNLFYNKLIKSSWRKKCSGGLCEL